MKKQALFLVIAVTFLVSSCSVLKTETSKTLDIYGAGVVQTPVLVDLDVQQSKITGTAINSNLEIAKLDAISDAIGKANADVLVEPTFKTVTSNGKTTATVVGFPATYKNFRTITEKDIELLKAGVIQKAEVHEPQISTKSKNRSGVLWGILAVAAAVGGLVLSGAL